MFEDKTICSHAKFIMNSTIGLLNKNLNQKC